MKKNKENIFLWKELCKYNINLYNNRYDNKYYNILKNNNIECLSQLDIYFVDNVDKNFTCTIFIQEEDYEKGMELIRGV